MDGLQYLGRSSFIYYQYAVLLVAWAGLVATLVSAHRFSHTQAFRILLFVGKVPKKLDTFAPIIKKRHVIHSYSEQHAFR